MKYQNVRGTQDYLPSEEVIRRNVRITLEDVFTRYGCQPLETPILNYSDLLASKYAGGAEIMQEMYTLSDRGNRELALRYDLTVPFAKVVAMNPTVRKPFKRYEIGKVFRDGPIKAGRFREFTQCDVDIVGVESQSAEAELLMMAIDAYTELGLDIRIQYNNRKLLAGLLEKFGVSKENSNEVILVLDKLEKIGLKGVVNELNEKGFSEEIIKEIKKFIGDGSTKDLGFFESYENETIPFKQGLKELKELSSFLEYLNVSQQCEFNPFLARGLEIYTGTVYEIFLKDGTIKSSIGSGGRYDNAIGGLMGLEQAIHTVGISFGLDVIFTALQRKNEDFTEELSPDYYIISLDNRIKEALMVAHQFRKQGYHVEIEMISKKLGKSLDRANKIKAKQIIVIGTDEVDQNRIKIKDMKTGEEQMADFYFNSSINDNH